MYTFSNRLRTFSFILIALGLVGIVYGFLSAPKSIQEVEKILAESHHDHHNHATPHKVDATHSNEKVKEEVVKTTTVKDTTNVISSQSTPADSLETAKSVEVVKEVKETTAEHDEKAHQEHLEHVYHQLSNKPWAAVYVAALFFMLLTLGVLAFYAIQNVAQSGWSPILFRVMQGITAYLPIGAAIFFILLLLSAFHINHLFVWMDKELLDPTSPKFDKLIANKSGYLNEYFWLARAAIFLIGWNIYRFLSRKYCLAQDDATDNSFYKKNFKLSAGFLVFFIVTESIMSWDWIMSFDPHWYSTLFGWYVFASFFVTGITVICMITLYLKSRGFLEYVNTSHIHDLAKFMFGISIFWTYLWFSQFMLIWYSNIPEEVTYFVTRIEQYNLPFFGMLAMNFIFPLLILINTDFKRITWILVMAGVVIISGHYIDFFNMIMPATVGDQWFIGAAELGAVSFFLGLFILVVFTALTKAPLVPKRNPFIEESKHFHY